jgi:hypothetical protein
VRRHSLSIVQALMAVMLQQMRSSRSSDTLRVYMLQGTDVVV